MPALSVVVPATDAPPTLGRCLAALAAADGADAVEVVVVEAPARLSAAAARNVGVARATGEVVVFVDADVEVHADALVRIRDAFAADPALVGLFGAYDDTPGISTTVSAFRNLLHHHVHRQGAGRSETFWTGLGAVRRDAFLAVGGFDEDRYPHPSVEDIDLGRRLAATGAPIVLDPSIQGTHLKAWTLRSMLWTDFARRGTPWVAMQLRARKVSSALNLGWRHRLSALACVVALVGLVLLRPLVVAGALGALCALNHAFYALLVRRQGPGRAGVGVLLHALHHLVAVASVPVGLWAGMAAERRAGRVRRSMLGPRADDAVLERPA